MGSKYGFQWEVTKDTHSNKNKNTILVIYNLKLNQYYDGASFALSFT